MKYAVAVVLLVLVGVGAFLVHHYSGVNASNPADVVLAPKRQQDVWDAEHVTFEIEVRFGKPLLRQLPEQREASELLDEALQGSVLPFREARRSENSGIVEIAWEAADVEPRAVDVQGLWDHLAGLLADFDEVQSGRLRVLKIKPLEGKHRWRTRILMTLSGVDRQRNPQASESEHEVDFYLVDGDDERPVAYAWRELSHRMRSSRGPLFKEVTSEAGLVDLPLVDNWNLARTNSRIYRFQMAVDDFNGDGFLDIVAGTHDGRPLMLISEGGKSFVERTAEFGLKRWDPKAYIALTAAVDIDADGDPDLVLGDKLYRNQGGVRFDDITADSGLTFARNPMGCAIADYDADGLLDLYILYQSGDGEVPEHLPWVGDDEGGTANQLFRNLGDGRFRDVTAKMNAGGGNRSSFAASWFFYDDDHLPDLYIANDFGKNVLLRNTPKGFEDISTAAGVSDFATSMGVVTADLNNDGHSDIYVANMYSKMGERIISHVKASDYPQGIFEQIEGSCAGNRLYRRRSDGLTFEDIGRSAGVNDVGWAYAPAAGDFDGDGWLDIYATTGFLSFDRGEPDG